MITDRDVAALARGIYDSTVTWDHLDKGSEDDNVFWGAKIVAGVVVAVFRGSVTVQDWFRNLSAVPNPFTRLGAVHYGFNIGAAKAADEISRLAAGHPIIFAGHSLGAARATLAAGYCASGSAGRIIARIVWGEPLSGFAKLAEIVSGIPNNRSYMTADAAGYVDPVTCVPLNFGPFRYTRATVPIRKVVTPNPNGGPLALHSIELYEASTPETIITGD